MWSTPKMCPGPGKTIPTIWSRDRLFSHQAQLAAWCQVLLYFFIYPVDRMINMENLFRAVHGLPGQIYKRLHRHESEDFHGHQQAIGYSLGRM